jgi:hypothetical protein
MGAVYFLRMNIGDGEDLLEIQASFEETGTTGGRESFCTILAEKVAIISENDIVDALCDDIYNYNRSEMTDNKE